MKPENHLTKKYTKNTYRWVIYKVIYKYTVIASVVFGWVVLPIFRSESPQPSWLGVPLADPKRGSRRLPWRRLLRRLFPWPRDEKRWKNAAKTMERKGKTSFFFFKGQKNRTLRLLKLPCVSLFSRANTEVQHLIIFVIGFLLCLVSPYAKKNRIPSRVARSVIGWRTISWS